MISRRTARLSLAALEAVLRRTRYNGTTLPPHIKAAMEELEAVADVAPTRQRLALAPTPRGRVGVGDGMPPSGSVSA